jgi:hypothetical protein
MNGIGIIKLNERNDMYAIAFLLGSSYILLNNSLFLLDNNNSPDLCDAQNKDLSGKTMKQWHKASLS